MASTDIKISPKNLLPWSNFEDWTTTITDLNAYFHAKCNDDAATSVVTDNGSGANNGVVGTIAKLVINFNGADGATTYTAETGQTVTFAGTAQLDDAQKKYGTTSLLLDGDSDYATVPDNATWNFGSGNFTIDFWIRWNDLTGYQTIYSQYVDGSNFIMIRKELEHQINFFVYDGAAIKAAYMTSGVSLAVDTWYHIAVVRDSTVAKIFINGNQPTVNENTAFSTNSVPDYAVDLRIGSLDGLSQYVNGWIDGFRITKGTALWTANFSVPTGEPMTSADLSVTGKVNDAFEFDGLSEYINVDALVADIASDTTGTLGLWMKSDLEANEGTILSFGDANGDEGFFIERVTATDYIKVTARVSGVDKWIWVSDADTFPVDTWVHLSMVHNGTTTVFYINGLAHTGTFSTSTDLTVWFDSLTGIDTGRIGAKNYNSAGDTSFFSGLIDDLRYYQNSQKSAAQILWIYNSGSGTESDDYSVTAPTEHTITGLGAVAAQESSTIKVGTYSAKLTYGYADATLYYSLPSFADYQGRKMTLGCWVYTSTASLAKIQIADGVGTSTSDYHTGGGSWEFLTVTRNIDSSATHIYAIFFVDTTGFAYFDNAILCEGDTTYTILSDYMDVGEFTPADRYEGQEFNITRRIGVKVPNMQIQSKTIKIKGMIAGTTSTTCRTAYDALTKALNAHYKNPNGDTPLRDLYLFDDRLLQGYIKAHKPKFKSALRIMELQWDFFVPDPFYRGINMNRTLQSMSSSPQTITVTNAGSAFTRPKFTVYADGGNITSIQIENLTTEQLFSYAGTISDTKALVFDTDQTTVEDDGADDIGNASGDLDIILAPGANQIVITVNANGGNAYIDWFDRWY